MKFAFCLLNHRSHFRMFNKPIECVEQRVEVGLRLLQRYQAQYTDMFRMHPPLIEESAL